MKNAIQPIRWRQRRKFTPEFKQDAVRMILMEGISIKETAEKLGIERSCLNRWKNRHLAQLQEEPTAGPNRPRCSMTPKELELENRQLRKQLRESELQREILKKALAIFSREPGNDIAL